jgi:hypothetical protein
MATTPRAGRGSGSLSSPAATLSILDLFVFDKKKHCVGLDHHLWAFSNGTFVIVENAIEGSINGIRERHKT